MPQMEPLVSVIMPVYRAEHYLQQCIDSICAQTYSQLEILLIDDGSTDSSGEICDANAKKDPRIKVIHKEHGGVSRARNEGLDVAKGEYISFVDADDSLHSRFIENLVGICLKNDCDIAQCDYLSTAKSSLKLSLNPQYYIKLLNSGQAIHQLCSANDSSRYAVVWNKIYKRELFESIRYPLNRIHEDESIIYLLFWQANKIAVTNQYLYYYLRHTESIMGKPFSVKRLDVLEALKERSIFLKENGLCGEEVDTLKTMLYLIDKYCPFLKNDVEQKDIHNKLSREREKIIRQIPDALKKSGGRSLSDEQMRRTYSYPSASRIVLYGAGNWGQQYYRWICDNHHGTVVGWVDNRWYAFRDTGYPVQPIDALLRMEFDYVLIAIESETVQKEVLDNLVFWGIPKEKVLLPSAE
ncbi:MAG TPA: hypothetical protein DF613_01125 [Lachnospiraceae bacterium]|nr:hypothetical protein [Lachnospiraceae bacterium]